MDSADPHRFQAGQSNTSGVEPLSMFIATAPGLVVNRITDVALKETSVTPGIMVVERSFGLLEFHHTDQGQVRLAGQAWLGRHRAASLPVT